MYWNYPSNATDNNCLFDSTWVWFRNHHRGYGYTSSTRWQCGKGCWRYFVRSPLIIPLRFEVGKFVSVIMRVGKTDAFAVMNPLNYCSVRSAASAKSSHFLPPSSSLYSQLMECCITVYSAPYLEWFRREILEKLSLNSRATCLY